MTDIVSETGLRTAQLRCADRRPRGTRRGAGHPSEPPEEVAAQRAQGAASGGGPRGGRRQHCRQGGDPAPGGGTGNGRGGRAGRRLPRHRRRGPASGPCCCWPSARGSRRSAWCAAWSISKTTRWKSAWTRTSAASPCTGRTSSWPSAACPRTGPWAEDIAIHFGSSPHKVRLRPADPRIDWGIYLGVWWPAFVRYSPQTPDRDRLKKLDRKAGGAVGFSYQLNRTPSLPFQA